MPFTDIREAFEYAGKKAGGVFSHGVQREMLDICETNNHKLELLDHLIKQGVPVPEIIGNIRCATEQTKQLSKQAHFAKARAERRAKEVDKRRQPAFSAAP